MLSEGIHHNYFQNRRSQSDPQNQPAATTATHAQSLFSKSKAQPQKAPELLSIANEKPVNYIGGIHPVLVNRATW
jgi:hypothetical protein